MGNARCLSAWCPAVPLHRGPAFTHTEEGRPLMGSHLLPAKWPSRVKTAQDSVQDADLGLSFASCLLGHPEQITSPFRASVVCTYKWSSLPLPITVELHEVLSVTMLSRLSGTKHAASPSPPYHHRSNRTFIDSLPKAKHTTRQLGRKKNVLQTADDAAAGGIRKASLRRCRCMVG